MSTDGIGTFRRRDAIFLMSSAAFMAATSGASAAMSKPLRGVMPIVTTPYTPEGAIDWDDLAKEMVFFDRCGVQGACWPQGTSDVNLMSKEERIRGMKVIADACRPLKVASIIGVQGKTTGEMLEYARYAETLAPDAMIAMPPSDAAEQTMEGIYAYYVALAGVTKRPVVVQTSISGNKDALSPSVDLVQRLAREFPNFGYVKEETAPFLPRMREQVKARPLMKGVFGASGGDGWLFELRLGLDGVQTGQGAYADVMERIWTSYQAGRHADATEAFSKFILMKNCEVQIPGTMRYILKKRGVFKSAAARKEGGKVFLPDFKPEEIAEIEMRFATLKPFLLPGL